LFALAALGACLFAVPAHADLCITRGRRCSTPPGRPGGPRSPSGQPVAVKRLAPGERIVVPVVYHMVFHSVASGRGSDDDVGAAPPLALTLRQTRVLNHAFRGTGISFRTAETAYLDFAPWRDPARPDGGPAQPSEITAMVREVTAGRPESLHVFLLPQVESRAANPDTKSIYAGDRDVDGIVMNWDYLPDVESLRPVKDAVIRKLYSQGETLVHLVGHYLGLVHTFEAWIGDGSISLGEVCKPTCAQTSDGVSDTPAHRWIWNGNGRCIPLDTCPDQPGMDPITNYMNLEPDLCASELTPGQIERIERMVRYYRPYLIVPAPGAP
jgi:hypothetical protein